MTIFTSQVVVSFLRGLTPGLIPIHIPYLLSTSKLRAPPISPPTASKFPTTCGKVVPDLSFLCTDRKLCTPPLRILGFRMTSDSPIRLSMALVKRTRPSARKVFTLHESSNSREFEFATRKQHVVVLVLRGTQTRRNYQVQYSVGGLDW